MADEDNNNTYNKESHNRLSIPEYEDTIYKLTLSMKRRFSPSENTITTTPSPQEAKQVRDLLRRLVEIDIESRELLRKVISLLEKDENLERYVKRRIEDPKVSKMWVLIEQLVDCHDCIATFNELFDDDSSLFESDEKCIKGEDKGGKEEELKKERFKVKNILNGTESEATPPPSSTDNKS